MKILTHGDTDGLVSATLLAAAFRVPTENIHFSRPIELARDLKTINEDVAIADIALNIADAPLVLQELARLSKEHLVLYIDHHPLPPGFTDKDVPGTYVHNINRSASEQVYHHTKKELPREFAKLALYGAIADYADDTEWVRVEAEMWDKRLIYFQAGLLMEALGEARHKYDLKRVLISHFLDGKEPSEIDVLVRLALEEAAHDRVLYKFLKENAQNVGPVAYAILERGSLAKGAHLIMGVTGARVGICGIVDSERVDMSLRAIRGEPFDLNELCRKIAYKYNGVAGGHAAAVGGSVPSRNFKAFVEELSLEITGILAKK